MRAFCLFFFLFNTSILASFHASAEILLTSITGYSTQENFISNGNNASLKIFGGLAGSSCSSSSNATCNNCDDATLLSAGGMCNRTRINPNLILSFTFSSSDKQGNPVISYTNSGGIQTPLSYQYSGTATTGPNQPVTVGVTWGTLCSAMGGSSDCSGGIRSTLNLNIGFSGVSTTVLNDDDDQFISFSVKAIDPESSFDDVIIDDTTCSGGGLCNFSLFPGDEKAYIKNINLSTSLVDTTVKHIQFFCSSVDHASITLGSTCTSPVPVTNGGLTDDTITGIPNGVTQYFGAAVIDEAGNIGRFFDRQNDGCPPELPLCHEVTPDEVVGLFADEMNCFIATAAYGSPMAKSVRTLRRFRDQILQKSLLGRWFIQTYYKFSPAAARWIAQSNERRTVARWLLTPLVISVEFMLNFPLLFTLIMATAFLVFASRLRMRKGTQ